MRNYCARCTTRIVGHVVAADNRVYCNFTCAAGRRGKSQFDPIYKYLAKLKKENA